MKKKPDTMALRAALYEAVNNAELSLADACRRMRKSIGLTQPEYAKLIHIAPRIIIDLERGVGNPTLGSLRKIGKPFGLEVAFRRRRT